MYSVDHNYIFDHMYCYEPGNLLNILNVLLKYQYLTKVVLNFKEEYFFCGSFMFFFCLVFTLCLVLVCLIVLCGHLLGKG